MWHLACPLEPCDYPYTVAYCWSVVTVHLVTSICVLISFYSNYLVDMDDERESVMISAEEQKENDLQVCYMSLLIIRDHFELGGYVVN